MHGNFFFLYMYASDFYSVSYQTSPSLDLVILFLDVLVKTFLSILVLKAGIVSMCTSQDLVFF